MKERSLIRISRSVHPGCVYLGVELTTQAYHDPLDEPGAAQLKRSFFDFETFKDRIDREMLKRKLLDPKCHWTTS